MEDSFFRVINKKVIATVYLTILTFSRNSKFIWKPSASGAALYSRR